MNLPTLTQRNHATLKLLFVALLSLAMLIPLMMVGSIISERQDMQLTAEQTIAKRWGGNQSVSGLVALVEGPVKETGNRGMEISTEWQASVLSELVLDAVLETEWRNLGIYQVPVYTARIAIDGTIDWAQLKELQPSGDLLFWLPLGDVRGVRDISAANIDGTELLAKPLTVCTGTAHGLQFTLKNSDREALSKAATSSYRLELTLAGSNTLLFLPLADTTETHLQADWPHPEFIGQFLPFERSIGEQTTASWKLLGLNRPFGNHWKVADMAMHQLNMSGFGMRLETPVDVYQRSERAVKYGFLFISLTFFTLFLFEVMTSRSLHPVPYVLTGAALAIFYLVLLALSEYLNFSTAFAVAAGLLLLIVTPYTSAVLGRRRYGLLVGLMMGLTYGLLYVLISAQHAALLLGSLSLLVAIAILMYLTRKIDWYAYGNTKP
jgi:inner membrane protein